MKSLLGAFVILLVVGVSVNGLQCGTNGLPVSQDMRRIYKTCMQQSTEPNYNNRHYHQQGGNGNSNGNNNMNINNNRRGDYNDYNDDFYYRPRSGGRFRRQMTSSDSSNYRQSSSQSSSTSTAAKSGDCMTHCLFKELNMLNNEDYPDKHKLYYLLTRNIRNTDIREFFSDSIHECFQFMEQEKRRDNACDYSKNLLNCMIQYAKANCDDWDDHSLMFS